MNSLRHWWTSEDSRVVLRTKQIVGAVVPEALLFAMKKRYYLQLIRNHGVCDGEQEMHALQQVVKKGDFTIDIGANIGMYTSTLSSLVGNEGVVWSIEPTPQNFDILKYLIRKNNWTNVEAFNVAMSESCGTVEMEIPHLVGGGESWYGARIFSPQTRHAGWRTVEAKMATLDSLTENTERPISFIKCDVEFHEMACLRGAIRTIEKWHPTWLIETIDDFYENSSDAENIVQFLAALGYKAYLFDGQGFRPRLSNEKSQNAFFFAEK
jgi:FkbM family methyltransferase